jgi:hypothetical protein
MTFVLTGIGILVYGAYVLHGGFYSDDWSNAADYQLGGPSRYWAAVDQSHRVLGGRPVLALLLPIPHALFGVHPSLHLGLALGLGIVTSLCFYALMRALRLAPLHAGAIAILTLLFPWSDSIRLWSTASVNSLSVSWFLLGLFVALRGLRTATTTVRAVVMHGSAVALYLLSVLTYEVTACAALLAGLLYVGRAPLSSALRRWLVDVVVVLGALVYSLTTTVATRHVGSIDERVHDVRVFGRESALVLASALVPVGSTGRPLKLLAVLVLGSLGAIAFRRSNGSSTLRQWALVIGVGFVALGAADFMLLGSRLHPLDPGTGNRVNVFAGLAYCLLAYGLIAAVAQLVPGRRGSALAIVAAAVIGVGYAVRIHGDAGRWQQASVLQHRVLASVDRDLHQLPPGTTLLTFGYPADVSPGVPIFDRSWDLNGAVRLLASDSALHAYPIYEQVTVRCARRGLTVAGPGSYGTLAISYRSTLFINVPTDGHLWVRNLESCNQALRSFRPGPTLLVGG